MWSWIATVIICVCVRVAPNKPMPSDKWHFLSKSAPEYRHGNFQCRIVVDYYANRNPSYFQINADGDQIPRQLQNQVSYCHHALQFERPFHSVGLRVTLQPFHSQFGPLTVTYQSDMFNNFHCIPLRQGRLALMLQTRTTSPSASDAFQIVTCLLELSQLTSVCFCRCDIPSLVLILIFSTTFFGWLALPCFPWVLRRSALSSQHQHVFT